jgi:hypothetical protein
MANVGPVNSPFAAGNGRSPRPSPDTGLTDAGQLLLIENIVQGLTFDVLRRESFLHRIANTEALKPLEQFGQTITFRVLNPPAVKAYVVNQDLVPDTIGGTNFSVTVDRAYYVFPTLDPIDIKQINAPLLEKTAKNMADAHAENEYQVVVAGLVAMVYAATAMVYHGQTPGTVFYQPAVPTSVAATDRTDADYIIKQFIAARKAANKLAIPKKGRYCMVNSDVEEILLNSDQFTYQISGTQNAKAIEDGEFGMRVAGFDIIVTDEIPTGTYGGQSNIAQCVLGHQNGFGFIRQIMETELNFKMQTKFSRGNRQLDVFGFGWSDSRYFGGMPIKVA